MLGNINKLAGSFFIGVQMTLIIALRWPLSDGEAVLMVSDTRATTSIGIMYEAKRFML